MSHDVHVVSREEVLTGIDRPSSPLLKTICLVFSAIGLIVFVIGLFIQPDRRRFSSTGSTSPRSPQPE
jgi:hypothetical protein